MSLLFYVDLRVLDDDVKGTRHVNPTEEDLFYK